MLIQHLVQLHLQVVVADFGVMVEVLQPHQVEDQEAVVDLMILVQ